MEEFEIFARAALATVLVASALHKLRVRDQVWRSVQLLTGVDVDLGVEAAIAAGALEACVAGCLLVPATVVIGMVSTTSIMLFYTILIAVALLRGSSASCNCFGDGGEPVGWLTLLRNALLVLCALVPSLWHWLSQSSPRAPVSAIDIAPALLGFAVGYLLINSDAIEEFWQTATDEKGGYAS